MWSAQSCAPRRQSCRWLETFFLNPFTILASLRKPQPLLSATSSDRTVSSATSARRAVVEVEREAVKKGHGFRAAARRSSALAHRRLLPQHQWDVLLPVQHPGRLQPVHRPLGSAGEDGGSRDQDHSRAGQGGPPEARTPAPQSERSRHIFAKVVESGIS